MKPSRHLILLLLPLLSGACTGLNPEIVRPKNYEKTLQLNAEQRPKFIGTWTFERTGSSRQLKERLTLNADSTYSGHLFLATRDSVVKEGVTIYGDWNVQIDSDLTTTSNGKQAKWQLVATSQGNCLHLENLSVDINTSPEKTSVALQSPYFESVEGSVLVMTDLLYNGTYREYRRQ